MRKDVINSVEENKIIVIVRGVEREKLVSLAEAMYDGGIRLMEITYDAKGIVSDGETAKNIEMLREHFDGRMRIGAGTVLRVEQVELTRSAGGEFIISPDSNRAVIEKTRALEMVSIPGALTPTEIQSAHSFGADFVKLFPVSSLGIDYVKAISAPLSHIKLLAVGGINDTNMESYLKAGVSGFGIGANIVDKKLILANEFSKIRALAQKYTEKIGK